MYNYNNKYSKGKDTNMIYDGKEIPKLGFGLMRLPMIGDEIDVKQACDMTGAFM